MLDLPLWRKLWQLAREKRAFYRERELGTADAIQRLKGERESARKGEAVGDAMRPVCPPSQVGAIAGESLDSLERGFAPLKKYVDSTLVTADAIMLWKNFAKKSELGKEGRPSLMCPMLRCTHSTWSGWATGSSRPAWRRRAAGDSESSSDEEDDFQAMLRKMFNPKELQKERDKHRYRESMVNAGRADLGNKGRAHRFSRFGVAQKDADLAKRAKMPLLGSAVVARKLMASRGAETIPLIIDEEEYFADIGAGGIDSDDDDDDDEGDDSGEEEEEGEEDAQDEAVAIRLEGELALVGRGVKEHYKRVAAKLLTHHRNAAATDESTNKTNKETRNEEQRGGEALDREHGKEGKDGQDSSAPVSPTSHLVDDSKGGALHVEPRPATTSHPMRKPSEKRVLATRLLELGRSRSERNLLLLKQAPAVKAEKDEVSSRLHRISSRLSLRSSVSSQHEGGRGGGGSPVQHRRSLSRTSKQDKGLTGEGREEHEQPPPREEEEAQEAGATRRRSSRRGSLRRGRIGLGLELNVAAVEFEEEDLDFEIDW